MNNEEVILSRINERAISFSRIMFLPIKRLFDIIISLIGLILLLPVMVIVKIVYLINKDFDSIFYAQKRIGLHGKEFKMYKFRTMVPDADKVLKQLLKDKKYKKEWDENQKFSHDPRITKIGKFLRKGSLDELPQVINVLKGEISLIGPRPLVKGELDKFKGKHEIYESVKPGITGWWAVNGRSATTYEERLNLEYYYVLNQSLSLDVKIFFKTFKVVLEKQGAK